MARVDYAPTSGGDEAYQQLVQQIKDERGGRVLNLYRMLLNSPPVAAGWLHMGTAIRFHAKLDGAVRELAICSVARATGAEYEWRAHSRLARQQGVSDAQLDDLARWRESSAYDARQRAVLAYAEQMATRIEVDDATFAELDRFFDAQELVELTSTIGFYHMVSRVLVALRIDLETS
ncbi:MAG: carboxymuconolactone decarboxylase family protein [Chloroflexi bacterium]|nr:carboxymuconolactone decarboxylase family protein [Chloroflexota bacterium]